MLKLQRVLNKILHCIYLSGFWIYHGFKICQGSGYTRVLNTLAQKMKFSIRDFFSRCDQMHSFLRIWSHLLNKSLMENLIFCAVICRGSFRKCFIINAWQDSEYSLGSKYGSVLNMSRLPKVLNKMLHFRYLIGFWIRFYFLNSMVTENWGF